MERMDLGTHASKSLALSDQVFKSRSLDHCCCTIADASAGMLLDTSVRMLVSTSANALVSKLVTMLVTAAKRACG